MATKTQEEIEGRTEAWHNGDWAGKTLAECLDMTEAEYAVWLRNPDVVPDRSAS